MKNIGPVTETVKEQMGVIGRGRGTEERTTSNKMVIWAEVVLILCSTKFCEISCYNQASILIHQNLNS